MSVTVDYSTKKVSWASKLRKLRKSTKSKVEVLENGNNCATSNDDECILARDTIQKFQEDYKFWRKEEIRNDWYDLESSCQHVLESAMNGKLAALEESIVIADNVEEEVNARDPKGRTLLHLASAFGHGHIVQFLLQKGALVNSVTDDNITPLMCGAMSKNIIVIDTLISYGANVNFTGNKTPLLWAVATGSLQCVTKIISAGANPHASSESAMSLLVATAFSRADVTNYLIENGADVNLVMNTTLDSALHLASAAGSEECVNILIKARLSPHVRNVYGETPLHVAATDNIIVALLDHGGNPDAVDINGLSPVHHAVMKGTPEFPKLRTLVKYGADVNLQDKQGRTPLHLSALQGASRKASFLLNSGANASIKDNEGVTPYEIMKLKMPHAVRQMNDCLDSAVRVIQDDPSEFDCLLALDFSAIGMIPPPVSDFRHSKILGSPSKLPGNMTQRTQFRNMETEFIKRVVEEDDKEILAHPLIEAFLTLKWKKFHVIFYLGFLFYFVMAVLYTYFTMDAYLVKCPDDASSTTTKPPVSRFTTDQKPSKRRHWGWTHIDSRRYRQRSEKDMGTSLQRSLFSPASMHPVRIKDCDIEAAAVIVWCFLAVATFMVIFKELLEISQRWKQYFRSWENYGQWAIVISIVITSYWDGWTPCKCTKMYPWHYSSAAAGLLISWTMLLVRIGKSPGLGIYVQMLTKVLQNFGKFILVFLSMLNAFALAFCVIFPEEPAFETYLQSMLKVFTMMTGELEYQDLFYGNYDHDSSSSPNREGQNSFSKKKDNNSTAGTMYEDSLRIAFGLGKELQYPYAAHALYCIFTSVMTISLMNLLVAMAVSDIQSLERQAQVDRLVRQTRSIYKLETFLFSKLLKTIAPSHLLAYLKRKYLLQPATKRCKYIIRPNDPRDDSLPEELKARLMQIVLKKEAAMKADTDISKSYSRSESLKGSNLRERPGNASDASGTARLEEQIMLLQNKLDSLSQSFTEQIEKLTTSLIMSKVT